MKNCINAILSLYITYIVYSSISMISRLNVSFLRHHVYLNWIADKMGTGITIKNRLRLSVRFIVEGKLKLVSVVTFGSIRRHVTRLVAEQD